jgi:RNA polymerase sigma-70 factor (ECF subfamily)
MHTNDTEHTDEEVARQVQQGDTESFGILVDRYEARLTRYGRKFLSRQEDIEDIVQDIFMRTFQNIQSFNPAERLSPWLYRIAHNAFVNELRRRGKMPLLIDFDTLFSHPAYEDPAESERDQRDMRALIDRGLKTLPPKYREVLVLHYFEELPYRDIADVLQVPIGTVGIRLKRAKKALGSVIDQHG